jgi:hypothetical protein
MRFSVTGTAAAQHKEFVTGAFAAFSNPQSRPQTPGKIPRVIAAFNCLSLLQALPGQRPATFFLPATTRPSASGRRQATVAARFYNLKPVDILQPQTR